MLAYLGAVAATVVLCWIWVGGYLADLVIWVLSKVIPRETDELVVAAVLGAGGVVVGIAVAVGSHVPALGGFVTGVGLYIAIRLPVKVRVQRLRADAHAAAVPGRAGAEPAVRTAGPQTAPAVSVPVVGALAPVYDVGPVAAPGPAAGQQVGPVGAAPIVDGRCPGCGDEAGPADRFCGGCGRSLAWDVAAPPGAPPDLPNEGGTTGPVARPAAQAPGAVAAFPVAMSRSAPPVVAEPSVDVPVAAGPAVVVGAVTAPVVTRIGSTPSAADVELTVGATGQPAGPVVTRIGTPQPGAVPAPPAASQPFTAPAADAPPDVAVVPAAASPHEPVTGSQAVPVAAAGLESSSGVVTCPDCGAPQVRPRRFCTACGSPMPAGATPAAVPIGATREDSAGWSGGGAAPAGTLPAPQHRAPTVLVVLAAIVVVVMVAAAILVSGHRTRGSSTADGDGGGRDTGGPTPASTASVRDGLAVGWRLDAATVAGQSGSWTYAWSKRADQTGYALNTGPVRAGPDWLVIVYEENVGEGEVLADIDPQHGTVRWRQALLVQDCVGRSDGSRVACLTNDEEYSHLTILDGTDGHQLADQTLTDGGDAIDADDTQVVVGNPDPVSGAPVTVTSWTWDGLQRWSRSTSVATDTGRVLHRVRIDHQMVTLRGPTGGVVVAAGDGSLLATIPEGGDVVTLGDHRIAALTAYGGPAVAAGAAASVISCPVEAVSEVTVDSQTVLLGAFLDDAGEVDRLAPDTCAKVWTVAGQGSHVVQGAGHPAYVAVTTAKGAVEFLDLDTGAVAGSVTVTADIDDSGYPGAAVVGVRDGVVLAQDADTHAITAVDPGTFSVLWRLTPPSGWSVTAVGDDGPLAAYQSASDGSTITLGAYLPAAKASSTPLAVPAGVASCPTGADVLAWGTWTGGWVLVCGTAADAPTWFALQAPGRDRFTSSQVTYDGSQYRGEASGGFGWFALLPATAGLTDSGGSETVVQTAVSQGWSAGSGDVSQQAAGQSGAFGAKTPEHTAADQARYLSDIIQLSAQTRAALQPATDAVRNCSEGDHGDYSSEIATITQVRDNRQQQAAAVRAAPVDLLADGTTLVAELAQALDLSRQADEAYLAMAQGVSSGGCGAATEDRAMQLSSQAGDAKRTFVADWNSTIAVTYDLPTTSRDEL